MMDQSLQSKAVRKYHLTVCSSLFYRFFLVKNLFSTTLTTLLAHMDKDDPNIVLSEQFKSFLDASGLKIILKQTVSELLLSKPQPNTALSFVATRIREIARSRYSPPVELRSHVKQPYQSIKDESPRPVKFILPCINSFLFSGQFQQFNVISALTFIFNLYIQISYICSRRF